MSQLSLEDSDIDVSDDYSSDTNSVNIKEGGDEDGGSDIDDTHYDEEEMEGGGAEDSEDPDDDVETNQNQLKKSNIDINQNEDTDNINDLDDDDDEMDENYLMKFDKEIRKNYLVDFHPEMVINNYEEIQALVNIKRDKRGVIIDDFHKTLPFLTKYEKTRVLGQRTKQINSGAKSYLDKSMLTQNGKPIIDGYLIALKELELKKIPFIIRRPLPNGASEYWKLEDLELIN